MMRMLADHLDRGNHSRQYTDLRLLRGVIQLLEKGTGIRPHILRGQSVKCKSSHIKAAYFT